MSRNQLPYFVEGFVSESSCCMTTQVSPAEHDIKYYRENQLPYLVKSFMSELLEHAVDCRNEADEAIAFRLLGDEQTREEARVIVVVEDFGAVEAEREPGEFDIQNDATL